MALYKLSSFSPYHEYINVQQQSSEIIEIPSYQKRGVEISRYADVVRIKYIVFRFKDGTNMLNNLELLKKGNIKITVAGSLLLTALNIEFIIKLDEKNCVIKNTDISIKIPDEFNFDMFLIACPYHTFCCKVDDIDMLDCDITILCKYIFHVRDVRKNMALQNNERVIKYITMQEHSNIGGRVEIVCDNTNSRITEQGNVEIISENNIEGTYVDNNDKIMNYYENKNNLVIVDTDCDKIKVYYVHVGKIAYNGGCVSNNYVY